MDAAIDRRLALGIYFAAAAVLFAAYACVIRPSETRVDALRIATQEAYLHERSVRASIALRDSIARLDDRVLRDLRADHVNLRSGEPMTTFLGELDGAAAHTDVRVVAIRPGAEIAPALVAPTKHDDLTPTRIKLEAQGSFTAVLRFVRTLSLLATPARVVSTDLRASNVRGGDAGGDVDANVVLDILTIRSELLTHLTERSIR